MTASENSKYKSWLGAIARTRLIFNTTGELEDYLDNHNIHNNSIERIYNTEAKARAAFADLCLYTEQTTNGEVDLIATMIDYEAASIFYKERLARRKNPEKIATDVLRYFYPDSTKVRISNGIREILKEMKEKDINEHIIILLVLGAWRGIESKEGDACSFAKKFNEVIELLMNYTADNSFIEKIPSATGALGERNKTRINLLRYVKWILSTFQSIHDIHEFSAMGKARQVQLNIAGYWNECGGKADRTDFWLIEDTSEEGSYFVNKYEKKQDGTVELTRYAMNILYHSGGGLMPYFLHPKAAKHFINGIKYDEGDHCFYRMAEPSDHDNVNEMLMRKKFNFEGWSDTISLTRVTNQALVDDYENMLSSCRIVNKYKEFEYDFYTRLYAITRKAVYISADEDGKFYKVPLGFHESLSQLNMNSKVGILTMNDVRYLVFDEIFKYIPVKKIRKYGIEVVDRIE